jgi:disulfide bond formation protein DsbB
MLEERPAPLTWIAFAASLLVLGGSLWLSIGMGLKACPLCFYQRTFVMGIVAVYAIGFVLRIAPASLLSALSLPMSAAAVAVAGFHVGLEVSGTLECPRGIFGLGTAPQQSLAGLAIVFVLLAADVVRGRGALRAAAGSILASAVIGAALGYASVASAPPIPGPPAAPYSADPEICRPPYRPG